MIRVSSVDASTKALSCIVEWGRGGVCRFACHMLQKNLSRLVLWELYSDAFSGSIWMCGCALLPRCCMTKNKSLCLGAYRTAMCAVAIVILQRCSSCVLDCSRKLKLYVLWRMAGDFHLLRIGTGDACIEQKTGGMGFLNKGRSLLGYLRPGRFQCVAEFISRRSCGLGGDDWDRSGICSNRS